MRLTEYEITVYNKTTDEKVCDTYYAVNEVIAAVLFVFNEVYDIELDDSLDRADWALYEFQEEMLHEHNCVITVTKVE